MKSRLILAFLFLCAGSLCAQTFRGGISGTVTDATGASVADAQVAATGAETGLTRTVRTDSAGNYVVNELPLGAYNVTVTKSGFRTATMKNIQVVAAADQRADFKLSPGQVQEIVEVTGEVPLVDTAGNTMGGTIEARQLSQLPVNGRDFTKVLTLVAGATSDPAAVSDSPGSFGYFSVNGNRGRSNNYLLDGTDMNDGYRNDPAINEAGVFGTPATILPVDALAEIPVISGAEAEFGRNSGGVVNIVTKSGTNNFHGSLFEYFRNSALDARNFFNPGPLAQDPFHNNQFGGSLGGPIWKDHTFFFLSYEGQRESGGISSPGHVPTSADIANAIATANAPGNPGASPVMLNLLTMHYPWPQPNIAPDANGNNLIATTNFSNRVDSFIAKVDHHFGQGDVFTGRYYFGDSDQSFPLALVGGGGLPGFNTVTPTRVQIASLSLTHVFTPKLLMEVRFGYNRFAEQFFPQDHTFDPASVGLNTVTGIGVKDLGLPLMEVSGEATVGANLSVPRGRVDTNWQYFTNFSYNTGRHNVKFGYEFRRTFVNGFFDAGYRGRLLFPDLVSFVEGAPSGSLTTGNHQAMGDSHRLTFQNNHAFYVQDNFRLTERLTLNAGLRWDYFGVIGEEHDRFSNFDPSIPGPVQVKQLYPKDYNNFAPRLSFAYDVFGNAKTVVRAGWGLFYDAFSQDFFVGQLPFNTFNPGPAYNFIPGVSNIQFSGSAAVAVVPSAGGCALPNIAVPNNPGLCAPPVFSGFGATDIFTVDQKIRTPYVQNFNFNIEQQIGGPAAVQIGYVGSTGRKLFRYRDLNQTVGGGPLPFPDFVYINQFESTARSSYNSLQATLKLRNMHGLSGSINYTWGHSIDNASDGQDYVPNASQPDNSFRPDLERANSNFDTRQRFSFNYNYEFPKASHMQWLLNGWALDGVVVLATGQPVNVNYVFEGDFNGSDEFFGRPDVVGDPFAGRHFPTTFLNASAFAVPCVWDPVAGACVSGTQHFGNLPRNAFVGPSYHNWDFSLAKTTALSERVNMQLRVDFFNILNHTNFSNPLLPGFAVDFLNGSLPDARGRGIGSIPITATPDVGSGNPFLGGGGPRNIQLAVRFTF